MRVILYRKAIDALPNHCPFNFSAFQIKAVDWKGLLPARRFAAVSGAPWRWSATEGKNAWVT
eukprot:1149527-Pelagomonas_calceolata.AAC.2